MLASFLLASVAPVVVLVVKPPVTALTLPVAASTLIVVPSVFTDTPSVSTVRPPLVLDFIARPSSVFSKPLADATFAVTLPSAPTSIVLPSTSTDTPVPSTLIPPLFFALTDTPSAPTVRPPSAFALTETLLSVETEIPFPAVTGVPPPAAPPCGCSVLIVTTCLPLASVVAVTVTPPSPLNSTSSPLFTIEVVLPLPFAETFQPKLFKVLDKSPALTNFFLSASSGAVTLPSLTVSSTVSAATLLLLSIFNPSPVFTLNLAERPFWSIVTPSPSTK